MKWYDSLLWIVAGFVVGMAVAVALRSCLPICV